MKIAVVGAGNWGKNLVRNFHALNALGAVVEVSESLRTAISQEYPGVPVYEDYHAVLERDYPAVAIATPVLTHYPVAREALLAGKHVFVEKPMTLSVAEAESLVELASSRGLVLMVGHLLLHQPAIQWIKSYLASGLLGKVSSLHQERLNLGRARAVENVLWSFGVHDIAVLLYLVDDVPSRIQVAGHRVVQAGVEDDVYLHLEFSGGVQAHLHSSWLWPQKRRRLTIVGTEAMLIYDESDQSVTLHRKGIGSDLTNRDNGSEVVFRGSGEPLRLELEHFLEAVKNGVAPIGDGASGVHVISVLEQATRILNGVSP